VAQRKPGSSQTPPTGAVVAGQALGQRTPLGDRRGIEVKIQNNNIFLMPVRYALGWDDSRTPNIDGSKIVDALTPGVGKEKPTTGKTALTTNSPFKVTDLDGKEMPLPSRMHYTLRRLRDGYLHVFSEKDKGWRIYKEGGLYPMEFVGTHGLPNQKPEIVKVGNTTRVQADPYDPIQSLGQVLSVPADSPIWLGYCDAQWTGATMDRARDDQEFRSRNMRKFDPTSWKNARPSHAAPLSDAGQWVADLAPRMSKQAFWFSSDFFRRLKPETIPGASGGVAGYIQGVVLALEDPAGIVMDLASSMEARYEKWCAQPDSTCPGRTNEWAMLSSKGIELLQVADAIRVQNVVFDDYRTNLYTKGINSPTLEDDWKYQSTSAQDFRFNVLPRLPDYESKPILEKAKKDAEFSWNNYKGLWDETARVNWEKEFEKRRDQFEKAAVWPVANKHVAWTHSKRFMAYFMDTFDWSHFGNGVVYGKTMVRCYAGVQDKIPIARDLDERLSKDITKENILARALLLNDKKAWDTFIHNSGIHGKHHEELYKFTFKEHRDDFWGRVGQFFLEKSQAALGAATANTDFSKMGEAPAVVNLVLGVFAGPLGRIAQKQVQKKVNYAALVAKGILGQSEFPVKITGSIDEIYGLVEQRGKALAESLGHRKMADIGEKGIKRAAGVVVHQMEDKLKSSAALETELYVSAKEFEALLENAGDPTKGLKASGVLAFSASEMKAITKRRELAAYSRVGKASYPATLYGIGALLQVFSLGTATADLMKNGADKKRSLTVGASFGALVATTGEGIEKTMATLSCKGISYGPKLSKLPSGAKWAGRAGTVLAGVLTALIDFSNAEDESKFGHKIRRRLYQASAWVGIAGTSVATLGWIAATDLVGGWLERQVVTWTADVVAGAFLIAGNWITITALTITALLQLSEPTATQSCLEFCCWGRNRKDSPYANIGDELKAIGGAAY